LIGDYRRILDGIHEKALHWQGFFYYRERSPFFNMGHQIDL
jgi:hypothetical protein